MNKPTMKECDTGPRNLLPSLAQFTVLNSTQKYKFASDQDIVPYMRYLQILGGRNWYLDFGMWSWDRLKLGL